MLRRSARTWCAAAILGCAVLLAFPSPAYAYIDPGAGSMLYQSLLAVLLGLGVTTRTVRGWLLAPLRALFRPRVTPKPEQSPANES